MRFTFAFTENVAFIAEHFHFTFFRWFYCFGISRIWMNSANGMQIGIWDEKERDFEFFSAEFYGHVTITFWNSQLFRIEFWIFILSFMRLDLDSSTWYVYTVGSVYVCAHGREKNTMFCLKIKMLLWMCCAWRFSMHLLCAKNARIKCLQSIYSNFATDSNSLC